MTITITATSVLCAIGRGSEQAWASTRAGIARIGSSHVMDRHFDPIQMGLVPEDALGTLKPELDRLPLPARARRMLRLAAGALGGLECATARPLRLWLGLPELGEPAPGWVKHFPRYLQMSTGIPIDPGQSVCVCEGRAAALLALEQAVAALAADPATPVIVGGVDTFLDLRLLASLDAEGRVLGPRVMDGFIPGEGAAFLLLEAGGAVAGTGAPKICLDGVASVEDSGHRFGSAPARGEGLADAIEDLRGRVSPPPAPIGATFAGFNGESFDAKLWGVARLRHSDFFSPSMPLEHPADKYGDAGAATGALLCALAAQALSDGSRNGPALVWAASDHAPCACALLSALI